MKLSDKGGLTIDKIAHTLMDFSPTANTCGSTVKDGYMAFYHEERLYSVRHIESGVVVLMYADSPYDAIEKVRKHHANYFGLTVDAERRVMKNCLNVMARAIDDVFSWDMGVTEEFEEFLENHDMEYDGESNPSDYLLKISDEKLFMDLISSGTYRGGMTSAIEECAKIGQVVKGDDLE